MHAICVCPQFSSVGVTRTSFLARKAGLKFGGLRDSYRLIFSAVEILLSWDAHLDEEAV
jgi:hypothetical protein